MYFVLREILCVLKASFYDGVIALYDVNSKEKGSLLDTKYVIYDIRFIQLHVTVTICLSGICFSHNNNNMHNDDGKLETAGISSDNSLNRACG